ncbi:MAG: hypothetical protein ACRBHB_22180 [Arenicella sp.]
MKKLTLISISLSLFLVTTHATFADLKQEPSLKIIGNSKLLAAKNAAPKTETVFMNKQKVEAKENMLRCWQNGELILAEHNWTNTVNANPILINKEKQKIYAFDYGETFCVYLGA